VSLEAGSFLGHINSIPEKLFGVLGLDENTTEGRSEILVRAEHVTIEKDEAGAGTVEQVSFAGHYIIYRVSIEGCILIVYRIQGGIESGDRVRIGLSREP